MMPTRLVTRAVQTESREIIAAANALADLIEAEARESLKHPKHAAVLAPIRARATKTMQRFFRRQCRSLLVHIDADLKRLAANNPNLKESDANTEQQAKRAVSAVLTDSLFPLDIASGMKIDYEKALKSAIAGGYEGLAEELGRDSTLAEDRLETYLRDNSLQKITGGLNDTTIERLRNVLADEYAAGGDYEDLKDAVKEDYRQFSDVRAGMIAQTEMNNAYNAGRKQLGLDLGFNEKSWNPDGEACPICLANVAAGWIPINDDFPSGDGEPTAHPNCDCSLDVRLNNDAA